MKVAIVNVTRAITNKSAIINLNLVTTNQCNQNCPMCNTTLTREAKNVFTLDIFKKYLELLKPYNMASCTISGGEPTLVKDLSEIIQESARYFPFGSLLITNLYGNTDKIMQSVEMALLNNVNISISFDGFGEVADKLRGSRNVSEKVGKHLNMLYDIKKSLKSRSSVTLHTVISDLNLSQVPKMFEYSKKFGWKHTIAPTNIFYYQEGNDSLPTLTFSQDLIDVCELALKQDHVNVINDAYIKGIAVYAQKRIPKICPYLKKYLSAYKLFLDAGGEVSLCDRATIGNLNNQTLDEMLQSPEYQKSYDEFVSCQGCWLACFVEPELRIKPVLSKEIERLYEIAKIEARETKPSKEENIGVY